MTSDMPTAIRARVSDSAIGRVTRFFNATEDDAFVELIQNARRSGATAFDVAVTPLQHGGLLVACTDNGPGIADPAVLLAFGESGWDETIAAAEDPAGIGVYALSRHGCTVSSRPRMPDGHAATGWRVQLTPDTFLGRDEAPILPDDCAPCPHGTAVSFVSDSSRERLEQALSVAARYAPIDVSFAGVDLPRKSFIDGAIHVEPWNGLHFGVFNARHPGYGEPDLNFHGLTLQARLPTIADLHGRTWSIRADIESCPDLELVLPARKEPLQTPFLDQMRGAARRAIFRAMEAADKPVFLSFATAKPPPRPAPISRSRHLASAPGAPRSPTSTTGAKAPPRSRSAPATSSSPGTASRPTSRPCTAPRNAPVSTAACSNPTTAWTGTTGTTRFPG